MNNNPLAMKVVILFILVFCIYHLFSNKLKVQNTILVISSTLFYSWFEWKFTFLILGYVFVNYFSGIGIQKSTIAQNIYTRRKYQCIYLAKAP